ncbi:MAG: cobalamin transport system substrate-binding protein [Chloroflexota bacterium]|jgi:iron complex transport system substrate-binding protein|nr:cobalamin transport system substrate-binding protein [Chloroflexota bacterium]
MTRRIALLFAFLFIVSCTSTTLAPSTSTPPTASPAAAAFPTSVTDFQGRSVAISKRPERIVSIGPSNTEFLFALGAGDRVVAVDDFSDQPAAAKTKEHVGGVKVSLEKVVSLKPDLILTVKFSDGTIEALSQIGAALLVVDPQGLADVTRTATLLGKAVGADGDGLAKSIQAKLDEVKAKTAAAPKLKVFDEEDASDLTKMYTVGPGSFLNDLITLAGGTNIAAAAKTAYPTISAEEVIRADPDVIVLDDAAFGTTVESIATRPGWAALSAVKNKRVYPLDANLMSRPGPRVGEAADTLARLVHPELFR